jgi:hypothetical protein
MSLLIDPAIVKHSALARARPDDGVPLSMCLRCGLTGSHAKPGDCIDALRERIAGLEFQVRFLKLGRRHG